MALSPKALHGSIIKREGCQCGISIGTAGELRLWVVTLYSWTTFLSVSGVVADLKLGGEKLGNVFRARFAKLNISLFTQLKNRLLAGKISRFNPNLVVARKISRLDSNLAPARENKRVGLEFDLTRAK